MIVVSVVIALLKFAIEVTPDGEPALFQLPAADQLPGALGTQLEAGTFTPEDAKMAELYRQHVLKEQPTIKIAGLGGKKKPVAEVLHKNQE